MNDPRELSVEELLKQMDECERTARELEENVKSLRSKLQANKDKFGPDISKWPKKSSQ